MKFIFKDIDGNVQTGKIKSIDNNRLTIRLNKTGKHIVRTLTDGELQILNCRDVVLSKENLLLRIEQYKNNYIDEIYK